jgi:hypothetical protein
MEIIVVVVVGLLASGEITFVPDLRALRFSMPRNW